VFGPRAPRSTFAVRLWLGAPDVSPRVPKGGLEPPRALRHWLLKAARYSSPFGGEKHVFSRKT